MDKIKRYIDIWYPVTSCSLRCHYCYITTHRQFNTKLPIFKYSAKEIRKALSKERLGGICLINICAGGETLLAPEIIEQTKELLLEGHYVMLVTNGTISKRFEEFSLFPEELMSHLFFKFSYHYLELKKRKLSTSFFNNIRMMKERGASFTLELTPCDELIPFIENIKNEALINVGAYPHITVARDESKIGMPILTKLTKDEYIKIWGQFDSPLFDFKIRIFGQKRKEFCYAGDWTFYFDISNGNIVPCNQINKSYNIMEDFKEQIPFMAVGNNCPHAHCWNGHSFIGLGCIKGIDAPTYEKMRNRKCTDGTEWLKPEMKAIMSSKLFESNSEYTFLRKIFTNFRMNICKI